MVETVANVILNEVLADIDIPDSAYEIAERRYKDLGSWFGRPESKCNEFRPRIYPQGSFRLGTVIKPLNPKDDYDLDLGCRLRSGVSKFSHTQKMIKALVGEDLESYRIARGIKEKKEEMHRCWRLKYADTLSFHMDTVPSINESDSRKIVLKENMIRADIQASLAERVAESAGAITDNRRWNYNIIDDDWLVSNSEGFARWFESRMVLAYALLEKRAIQANVVKIDDLPSYQWKSPLQRAIQLLKRHRDVMFADKPDNKPISVIITTLSGRAYQGENDIMATLERVLNSMGEFVNSNEPRVPNPVNPVEDFADKWSDEKYAHLRLEQNFWRWLQRAKDDFHGLGSPSGVSEAVVLAKNNYAVNLAPESLMKKLGTTAASGSLLKEAALPSDLSFPDKPIEPNKPAGFAL